MFRRSSNKVNNSISANFVNLASASVESKTDQTSEEKLDEEMEAAENVPEDPTIPRTTTLKRISKQLSKIPFRRRTLSKDTTQSINADEKGASKKKVSGKLEKEAVLEAIGSQEKSTSIPTSGDNSFDQEVSEYLRKLSAKQNLIISELEEKLLEKERSLIVSQNLYDTAISQMLAIKERLCKDDELQTKNETLVHQIATLDSAKFELQTKLEETLANLEKFKSEKDSESANLSKIQASIDAMKESKSMIETQVSKARKESIQIQNEMNENHQSILQENSEKCVVLKDERLEESRKAYLELRKEMDVLQQSTREVEIKYNLLVVETSKSNKKILDFKSNLKSESQVMDQERQVMEKENIDLKLRITQADQSANEIKVARGVLSSENTRLISDNKLLSSELTTLKSEILKLKSESSAIKNEREAALKSEKSKSRKSDQSKSQLESEIAEMKQKKIISDQALNEMKIARDVMSLELTDARAELSQLRDNNEELFKEKLALKTQLASLSDENSKLQAGNLLKRDQQQSEQNGEYYENLTKSLIREKSILEYALGTLKTQFGLKEKEMDNNIKNLTTLLLNSERSLSDANAKTAHLHNLNEELEKKLCYFEGYHKEPEDKLISLLSAVESRLNLAMIDIIICQENLENVHSDRDQKIQLLEESKKKVATLQDLNARNNVDIQALKEELFSCKLNYKDEIEKLIAQIVSMGGTTSVSDHSKYGSLASIYSKESFAVNEESQYGPCFDEDNLKIPRDLIEVRIIDLGLNIVEILKCLTTRVSVGDVNQRISKFWSDLKVIQSALNERHEFERTNSTLSSIFPGDAALKMVPQNSVLIPLGVAAESSKPISFLEGPTNSFMSETDHSSLVIDIKKKEQDINYLEGEVAKLMNIVERREEMIKELQCALDDLKMRQEPSEVVSSLRAELEESNEALSKLKSEKNSLADKNYILMSNSVSGISESQEALEFAQKMGEMELRHALYVQKWKEQEIVQQKRIKYLESQLSNTSNAVAVTQGSASETKLEKLLMASKIELFNLKNQSKLAAERYVQEIATLEETIAKVQNQSSHNGLILNENDLMDASEFTWNIKSIYQDVRHVILNYPVAEVLRVEKRHLHYYHLCYTTTILSILMIALPMTWSLLREEELPMYAKHFTQFFACLLAFLITKRPG